MKRIIICLTAAILGITAGLFTSDSLQTAEVTDSSMTPEYQEGSHVLIARYAYRDNSPQEGDVVVFPNQIYTETGEGALMIKRVTKVNDDFVFVTGDNRSQSTDSRSETVGEVYVQDILGKVIYKW